MSTTGAAADHPCAAAAAQGHVVSYDPAYSPANTSSEPLPKLEIEVIEYSWAGACHAVGSPRAPCCSRLGRSRPRRLAWVLAAAAAAAAVPARSSCCGALTPPRPRGCLPAGADDNGDKFRNAQNKYGAHMRACLPACSPACRMLSRVPEPGGPAGGGMLSSRRGLLRHHCRARCIRARWLMPGLACAS